MALHLGEDVFFLWLELAKAGSAESPANEKCMKNEAANQTMFQLIRCN
jgi:hypothetical protein